MSKADEERFGLELTQAIPALRGRAMQLTRHAADASDLVQETLLKAWKARHQFQTGTHLKAWLMCIMRNAHMSNLRTKGRETAAGLSDYAEALTTPPSQEWAVATRKVARAIAELSAEHASAIMIVGALGESYEEASSRFGRSQGTMKSRVCRARRELRDKTCVDQLFVSGGQAAA